jgi:hypothetical protein
MLVQCEDSKEDTVKNIRMSRKRTRLYAGQRQPQQPALMHVSFPEFQLFGSFPCFQFPEELQKSTILRPLAVSLSVAAESSIAE